MDHILIKLRIVLLSHLSDIADGGCTFDQLETKANFVKYLLIKFPDTNVEINPNAEFELFQKERYPQMGSNDENGDII
jgi:hypothetical protein